MFKLLSKESNIFSIPVYIGFLLLIVVSFNILNINSVYAVSAAITFAGIALGYFCFNAINLNYQTHLPLFLYTFFIFAFYPGDLDVGIAVALLTNSFMVLILTSGEEQIREKSYLIVGAILAINFICLPTTWPIGVFVLLHIFATSNSIGLNIFRLLLGILMVAICYFSAAYFLNWDSWNGIYFPFWQFGIMKDYTLLLPLIPILLLMLYGILDFFRNFNKSNPTNRFKYTFLLLFFAAQLVTVVYYMGFNYEYLLLMVLPVTIILSRMLNFLPKTWMKETGLGLIILSLLAYKFLQIF